MLSGGGAGAGFVVAGRATGAGVRFGATLGDGLGDGLGLGDAPGDGDCGSGSSTTVSAAGGSCASVTGLQRGDDTESPANRRAKAPSVTAVAASRGARTKLSRRRWRGYWTYH